MINKKDLELKLLLRESHIQQLNLKVDKLQQRISKAIEYINQGTELCEGEYTNYCDNLGRESLLNILQGVDKE